MVRAKFKVESYETRLDRQEELRTIKLSAVVGNANDSEENKKFFKYTPYGQIHLGTLNQRAWEQFPLGADVYVDFTGASESPASVDEYFIAFYTKDCPKGTIDGVRVRLDTVRKTDMDQSMAINLCEHPLYREIVQYVQANPVATELTDHT
jgi:hypothetical protein